MSPRPELREKLSKAVRLIVNSQNREGGWRYLPQRADADISVTVCQVMALRAARNAGINVPRDTIDRSIEYVKRCQNPDGGFMYTLQGGESAFARSAAALVALYSAGIYEGPVINKGLTYLTHFAPNRGVARQEPYYYYGHLLRHPSDVASWRRPLVLVSGHPRQAWSPANTKTAPGSTPSPSTSAPAWLFSSRSSQQLFADFSALARTASRESREGVVSSQ